MLIIKLFVKLPQSLLFDIIFVVKIHRLIKLVHAYHDVCILGRKFRSEFGRIDKYLCTCALNRRYYCPRPRIPHGEFKLGFNNE